MNFRCKRCVCNVLRQHYIKNHSEEYKEAISEWCKLNKLNETIEWKKLTKQTVVCPSMPIFVKYF